MPMSADVHLNDASDDESPDGSTYQAAIDIMAMLKAMQDDEGVFLAAEFLALPDRTLHPGDA